MKTKTRRYERERGEEKWEEGKEELTLLRLTIRRAVSVGRGLVVVRVSVRRGGLIVDPRRSVGRLVGIDVSGPRDRVGGTEVGRIGVVAGSSGISGKREGERR